MPSQIVLAPGSPSCFLPRKPPPWAIERTTALSVGVYWQYFCGEAVLHIELPLMPFPALHAANSKTRISEQ